MTPTMSSASGPSGWRLRPCDNLLGKLAIAAKVVRLYAHGPIELWIEPTLEELGDGDFLGIALDQEDELHVIVSNSFER